MQVVVLVAERRRLLQDGPVGDQHVLAVGVMVRGLRGGEQEQGLEEHERRFWSRRASGYSLFNRKTIPLSGVPRTAIMKHLFLRRLRD